MQRAGAGTRSAVGDTNQRSEIPVSEQPLMERTPTTGRAFEPLSLLARYAPVPVAAIEAARPRRRCRVALYSHDTLGLGHRRRNLLIAHALSGSPLGASILIINGSASSACFPCPPGADCLTLPALSKEADGRYQARHLDLSLEGIVKLRRTAIRAALEAFEPDLFIVDNVPRGAARELDLALEFLRQRGRTRCVLGLRDVLDDPEAVREEWERAANEQAVRDYYDAVWVYGDPSVYDAAREYGFSAALVAKMRYTGYLDHRVRLQLGGASGDPLGRLRLPPGRLVLCLVGGGQDGGLLAESFARAEPPEGYNSVLITGPFMPADAQARLRALAQGRERLRVLPFVSEPSILLSRADRVISMGGYNTVWEVLSFEKPALIVPRVRPRAEQLVRAQRLQELGFLDVLHPDWLTPGALEEWIAREPRPWRSARSYVDFGGLDRLPTLAMDLASAEVSSHARVARVLA